MDDVDTLTTPLTRDYKGTIVPVPGVYEVDPKHTTVEFVARHLMITKVRGRLDDVSGTVHIGEVPEESSVEVTIGAKSVDTGEEQRDAHLRTQTLRCQRSTCLVAQEHGGQAFGERTPGR